MVITDLPPASITLTAAFQPILETITRGRRWFEGWIYCKNLLTANNDVLEIKVWVRNSVTDTLEQYTRQIITGTQESSALFIGGVSTTQIKIEVAQTNASPVFKSIHYEFCEVT